MGAQSCEELPCNPAGRQKRSNLRAQPKIRGGLQFESGTLPPLRENQLQIELPFLRKNIEGSRTAIDFDAEALRQEQQAFSRPELTERGHRFWDRSEAQQLLREELGDEGLSSEELESLKPKDLYNGQNKDEYQKFDLTIFANHFYKVRTSL